MGIPVFNTPGANANAVKELVVCSLLLASRVVEGNNRCQQRGINAEENNDYSKISVRIEKDKAMFGGTEIARENARCHRLGRDRLPSRQRGARSRRERRRFAIRCSLSKPRGVCRGTRCLARMI